MSNPRKAALRSDPGWLDALDLGEELAQSYRPELSTQNIAEKNAAELWADSLPDLAIAARRRELTERDARRAEYVSLVLGPAGEPVWADRRDPVYTRPAPTPLPGPPGYRDCIERAWVWPVLSLLFIAAIVAAGAWRAGWIG